MMCGLSRCKGAQRQHRSRGKGSRQREALHEVRSDESDAHESHARAGEGRGMTRHKRSTQTLEGGGARAEALLQASEPQERRREGDSFASSPISKGTICMSLLAHYTMLQGSEVARMDRGDISFADLEERSDGRTMEIMRVSTPLQAEQERHGEARV